MSNSTISTFELFQMFPDGESARVYMEGKRWPDGVVCPACGEKDRIKVRANGMYRCNACIQRGASTDFSVRTGTIFEKSKIPLNKWLYAMYLLVTARKGISSMQLAKQIGVTQKSAWFMLQRLREACGNDPTKLAGVVEIDETFIGGKEANKHEGKKLNKGRGAVGKRAVIGLREKDGRTKAMPVFDTSANTLQHVIHKYVETGSTLHTDEHGGYTGIGGLFYEHETICHSAGEYVRDGVTTNGIESVWAVMKRGLQGVYHHASDKHLDRYVNEFTFRLNDGRVQRHTLDRIASLLLAGVGQRLTYKDLIA